jgi:membrane protein DedA with SNARE-associated domain
MTQAASLVGMFVACAFGVPVPEDVALFSAGLTVSQGVLQASVVFPVAWSAVVTGDSLAFALGRIMGTRVFEHWFMHRLVSYTPRERIERRVRRWGSLTCFGARFVPGGRIPMYAMAGASGVSLRVFLPLDAVAAAASVGFWQLVGRRMGAHLPALLVDYAQAMAICALVAGPAALAYRALRHRPRAPGRDVPAQHAGRGRQRREPLARNVEGHVSARPAKPRQVSMNTPDRSDSMDQDARLANRAAVLTLLSLGCFFLALLTMLVTFQRTERLVPRLAASTPLGLGVGTAVMACASRARLRAHRDG